MSRPKRNPKSKIQRNSATPATAPSLRALAAALGKNVGNVSRNAARDDWPFGKKDIPIDSARKWMATNLSPNPAADDDRNASTELKDLGPKTRADVALKLTRREKLRHEIDVAKGLYHNVEECRARHLRQIHDVKTAFLNMADGLPFSLDDKVILRGRVLEILRMFSVPPAQSGTGHEPDRSQIT
jgi:hypothetical protein